MAAPRIKCDCFLRQFHASAVELRIAFRSGAVHQSTGAPGHFLGVQVTASDGGGAAKLLQADFRCHVRDDPLGDVVEQGEQVADFAVVVFRLKVFGRCRQDQLGGSAKFAVDAAHAAFQDVVNPQLPPDPAHVAAASLELKTGIPRDHFDCFEAG